MKVRKDITLYLSSLRCGGVDDPGGEDAEAGVRPRQAEHHKGDVTAFLRTRGQFPTIVHHISRVLGQLGQLHPVVGQVVDDEDKGAHPVHVVAPAEGEQGEGGDVVDEHLQEVFSPHVTELGHQKRKVEGHFQHIVPPNSRVCKKI